MFDHIQQYTIPELHPVLVHFPIALGVVAVVFGIGWLLRNKLFWLYCTIWLHGGAFIGAVLALRTGEAMEEQSEGIAIVDELVAYHETWAERTTWLLGISLIWMIVAYWITVRDTRTSGARLWVRLVTLVIVLTAAILVGLTGHIGGLMTWGVAV